MGSDDNFNFLTTEVKKLRELYCVGNETSLPKLSYDGLCERYQRDYTRILHSTFFRRLHGKMQFLPLEPANFDNMRLTHSMEVAEIACRICANLEKKYGDPLSNGKKIGSIWQLPDLVSIQAICLAHDIGNPPFGHAGEKVLDGLVDSGFEGNAQTFRILNHLERIPPDFDGLNLTVRCLLGVVKHFKKRSLTNKKFLYTEDYKLVDKLWEAHSFETKKTLDCAIMDIADDIANTVHDLEDALRTKWINIDDILILLSNDNKDAEAKERLEVIVSDAKKDAKKYINCKSHDEYESIHNEYESILRKSISLNLAGALIEDVDVKDQKTIDLSTLKPLTKLGGLLLKALKIDNGIFVHEKIGEKVIHGLFEVYSDTTYNKVLPHPYRNYGKRGIIDYIAGMIDQFAAEQYHRFYGKDACDDGEYYTNKQKHGKLRTGICGSSHSRFIRTFLKEKK